MRGNPTSEASRHMSDAGKARAAKRRELDAAEAEPFVAAVAAAFKLDRAELNGRSRNPTRTRAKRVAVYLMAEDAHLGAVPIARSLGLTHATINHHLAVAHAAVSAGDPAFTKMVAKCRDALRVGAPPPGGRKP